MQHIAQTSAAVFTDLLQIGETVRHARRHLAGRIATLARLVLDPYRPELHYMRGPGPKWREKHGLAPRRGLR
jgi:hypothetical protein